MFIKALEVYLISLIIMMSLLYIPGEAATEISIFGLNIGDYAVYLYSFEKVEERYKKPGELDWVYVLMEADMLTSFTSNNTKLFIMNYSEVVFSWRVEDELGEYLLLKLNLSIHNALMDGNGEYTPVNRSYVKYALLDKNGYLYDFESRGWVEDWLFLLDTSSLANGTLKLGQPLPLIGGNYAIEEVFTKNISRVREIVDKINQLSREIWGRDVRYILEDIDGKLLLNIGDAIISPFVVYPPPSNMRIETMDRLFTGERLAVGGFDAIKYVDPSSVSIDNERLLQYLRSFPTYFEFPREPNSPYNALLLGVDGYTYAIAIGIFIPKLMVYDSISGLLLHVEGGKMLPPSLIFKSSLNGHAAEGWRVSAQLYDTNIDLERPIIGKAPTDESTVEDDTTNEESTNQNVTDVDETITEDDKEIQESQPQIEESVGEEKPIAKNEEEEPVNYIKIINRFVPYFSAIMFLIFLYLLISYKIKKKFF